MSYFEPLKLCIVQYLYRSVRYLEPLMRYLGIVRHLDCRTEFIAQQDQKFFALGCGQSEAAGVSGVIDSL